MTSSLHGPYGLGYTRTTLVFTVEVDSYVNESESTKDTAFRSISVTRDREAGIASNRGSPSCGEWVLRSSTYRPSRHGN